MTLRATVEPAEQRPAGGAGPDRFRTLPRPVAGTSAPRVRPRVVLVDSSRCSRPSPPALYCASRRGSGAGGCHRTGRVLVGRAALAAGWIGALWVSGVWDARILGNGLEEFRRLARASLFLFGVIGVLSYLTKASLARGFIAVALPLGMLRCCSVMWAGAGGWCGNDDLAGC